MSERERERFDRLPFSHSNPVKSRMLDSYLTRVESAYTSNQVGELTRLLDPRLDSRTFIQLRQHLVVRSSSYTLTSSLVARTDSAEFGKLLSGHASIETLELQRRRSNSIPTSESTPVLRLPREPPRIRQRLVYERFRKTLRLVGRPLQVSFFSFFLLLFSLSLSLSRGCSWEQ
jgi:hypothetical protein